MKTFIEKYRGAAVYEVGIEDPSQGKTLGTKVTASAMIPEPANMKVDFHTEAENKQEALKKIRAEIDRYLEKHGLDEFVSQNP